MGFKEVFSNMVNKKMVSFRIDPYINEAMSQILLDILVIIFAEIVLIFTKIPLIVCASVVVVYTVVALLLHYRVAIQATIDKRKEEYVTETIKFVTIAEEVSFAGDWLGHSYIESFYPKTMRVSRCKIIVIDNQGKKKKLRSVMSFRRILNFSILAQKQIEHLQVAYLKRSKILVYVDLPETSDGKDNNKKISRKKNRPIENAIHFINASV